MMYRTISIPTAQCSWGFTPATGGKYAAKHDVHRNTYPTQDSPDVSTSLGYVLGLLAALNPLPRWLLAEQHARLHWHLARQHTLPPWL
jgi:hypothetical protein